MLRCLLPCPLTPPVHWLPGQTSAEQALMQPGAFESASCKPNGEPKGKPVNASPSLNILPDRSRTARAGNKPTDCATLSAHSRRSSSAFRALFFCFHRRIFGHIRPLCAQPKRSLPANAARRPAVHSVRDCRKLALWQTACQSACSLKTQVILI